MRHVNEYGQAITEDLVKFLEDVNSKYSEFVDGLSPIEQHMIAKLISTRVNVTSISNSVHEQLKKDVNND